jgi:hypothetical protein
MKLTNYLPLSVAAIALSTSYSAFAQGGPEYGSAVRATVQLTVSIQEPIYTEESGNGTFVTAPQVYRFGNKEIIEAVLEEESTDGWSIVYVKYPYSDPSSAGELYVTHTNGRSIPLSEILDINDFDGPTMLSPEVYTEREVRKSSEDKSSSEGTINTRSFSSVVFDWEAPLSGYGNLKHQIKYLNQRNGEEYTNVFLLSSFSLSPITGGFILLDTPPDDEVDADGHETTLLFEGSIYGKKGVPYYGDNRG